MTRTFCMKEKIRIRERGIEYSFFSYVPINICLPSVELWEPAEVKKKRKQLWH